MGLWNVGAKGTFVEKTCPDLIFMWRIILSFAHSYLLITKQNEL